MLDIAGEYQQGPTNARDGTQSTMHAVKGPELTHDCLSTS